MHKQHEKTRQQIGRIFGLGRKRGLEKEDLESIAGKRLSMLSFEEANAVILNLGGDPFKTATPRRTVNQHRQQAGVPQIAQKAHIEKMHALAEGRNMSEAGLRSLGERIIKHWPPRTTAETNKVIEALKAMNERDRAKEAA